MSTIPKDPLLGAAKAIVILLRIIVIFLITIIGIGIGALVSVGHATVMAKIAEVGAPGQTFTLLIVAFGLVMVLLALAYKFFEQLSGVIDSVSEGEPFHADNADRLSRMGWISICGHALGLLLAGIAAWFVPYLDKADQHTDIGFGVDLAGILLTLILFILARVFRRGAEMREELEGTV